MLTELACMRTKEELDATAQCLADERMAHKDARHRMQLELAEASALSDELQRSLQHSLAGEWRGESANGAAGYASSTCRDTRSFQDQRTGAGSIGGAGVVNTKIQRLKVVYLHKLDNNVHYLSQHSIHYMTTYTI